MSVSVRLGVVEYAPNGRLMKMAARSVQSEAREHGGSHEPHSLTYSFSFSCFLLASLFFFLGF